jgi:hypothetical protein
VVNEDFSNVTRHLRDEEQERCSELNNGRGLFSQKGKEVIKNHSGKSLKFKGKLNTDIDVHSVKNYKKVLKLRVNFLKREECRHKVFHKNRRRNKNIFALRSIIFFRPYLKLDLII